MTTTYPLSPAPPLPPGWRYLLIADLCFVAWHGVGIVVNFQQFALATGTTAVGLAAGALGASVAICGLGAVADVGLLRGQRRWLPLARAVAVLAMLARPLLVLDFATHSQSVVESFELRSAIAGGMVLAAVVYNVGYILLLNRAEAAPDEG